MAFLLMEKGPYQSLYGPDRKIGRLLHDRNGDGVADTILVFGAQGQLRVAEVDTDLDKVVDRWEHFRDGVMVGITFDIDGDGRPDRSQLAPRK
jgi:hypothetical protein